MKQHPDDLENWPVNVLPYGWAGEYSNANTIGFENHWQLYIDMITWILQTIENPRQNAHWSKIGDCLYFQIRRRRDFVLFTLRWGSN